MLKLRPVPCPLIPGCRGKSASKLVSIGGSPSDRGRHSAGGPELRPASLAVSVRDWRVGVLLGWSMLVPDPVDQGNDEPEGGEQPSQRCGEDRGPGTENEARRQLHCANHASSSRTSPAIAYRCPVVTSWGRSRWRKTVRW